ncbi:MAG TPA: hypothetical protein PKL78_07805, partial [Anaerolineales bacterium]|nr:hypothetical protein [Anaerolineales bacterium]
MFKKLTFIVSIAILILTACTTATPTITAASLPAASDTPIPAPATAETSSVASPTNSDVDTSSLACANGGASASLTPELTEGPYFTPNSPEHASLLEEGMPGTKLIITGYVYDTNCQPVANALLDFWQADANGVYDNSGYTLRGHQFTDANG